MFVVEIVGVMVSWLVNTCGMNGDVSLVEVEIGSPLRVWHFIVIDEDCTG